MRENASAVAVLIAWVLFFSLVIFKSLRDRRARKEYERLRLVREERDRC